MTSLEGLASGAAVLQQCLTTIVGNDIEYASCVVNSGLFDLSKEWVQDRGYQEPQGNSGNCHMLCTASTITASASCCHASANVRACEPSATGNATTDASIAKCKREIDKSFSNEQQCEFSSANVGLIAVSGTVALAVFVLMVLSRAYTKKQASMSTTALESRFAAADAATNSRWTAMLRGWHQITNLVWKNLIIRRSKPVAFFFELFLPVILGTILLFLVGGKASLNAWAGGFYDTDEASTRADTIVCTGIDMSSIDPNSSEFYSAGQTVIGMFFLISYIKFVSTTTATMVIEKETRVREIMKIMGLSDFTILSSWFVTNALLSTPLAFAIAAELKYGRVFPGAEYATLVMLFWCLSLSIVSFSYCITPFFNKSRTASIASVLLWLILFFPFFTVQSKTNSHKYWAALSPPTAFALGVDALIRHAQLGLGLTYSIAVAQAPITVPSAFEMSCFLVLDSLLLFALGWYLEQVLPQQFGVRKPWNFLFKRDFWLKARSESGKDSLEITSPVHDSSSPRSKTSYIATADAMLPHPGPSEESIAASGQPPLPETVEPVGAALAIQEQKGTCLQIRGLRKVFSGDDGGETIAVKQLDLTMYSGHITALLGHNGAGKTTTISMLTGLITPTSGDAMLYGRSLKHDFNELRQIMGICPQHDVLLNELTVEQHLELFGTMKHVPPHQLKQEVNRMIQEVGLTEKRKTRSKDLSGGQKRKLSVAIAFIGDSKLVFLDEPTSGMDPYSRRFTWNLLQRNREDRVIVLTTHFMDEADILGDRIAIMADGELCCAGSSLFLKNQYGAGYNLTMIKGADCDVEAVSQFLRQFVPDVKCLSNFGSEVVFQLPSASSGMFSAMLQSLDETMHRIHIVEYGISVTTLEEVFLRIARDREVVVAGGVPGVRSANRSRQGSVARLNAANSTPLPAAGGPTFWTQFSALASKRFQITKRDRKSLMNAVIIPLTLLVILAALPEIRVASLFGSDYASAIASQARQDSCSSDEFSMVPFDATAASECLTSSFDFCSLGVVDCDAAKCCRKTDPVSPYYACNTCKLVESYDGTPARARTPCYNNECLDRDAAKLQVTLNSFLIAIIVMLAFAFIPAAIVAFVVREKNPIQNAKSLQLICGANTLAYWLANWTHDILAASVSVAATVVIVPLSSHALSHTPEILGVTLLVGSHVLAVIPFAYLVSFRYEKHAVAQTALIVFGLVTGGLLSIFSFLCREVDLALIESRYEYSGARYDPPNWEPPIATGGFTSGELDRGYLRWLFMLFPGYSLHSGIYEIATRKLSQGPISDSWDTKVTSSFFGLFEGLGRDPKCISCWKRNASGCCTRGVFDIDVAGAPIAYALFEALVFTLLIFAIENRSVVWKPERKTQAENADAEDDDVAQERHIVEHSQPSSSDNVFIRNLRQQYGKKGKVVLDNLCLSIPKGECFGYLGINGAGKSTTIKVLTGQIAPTNGFVSLGGYDLSQSRDAARTIIGYCPQFNSLHDLLTVKEQLGLYARLKGIPEELVEVAIEQKIEEVGLTEYRDRLTRGLSGGNKRKVSTAIALIGAPRIIFLDEPSTGVDPSSRRKMWDVIAGVCAQKESSVVLTTHSMEECEALCTRVGILVSGKLKCLGSVEHLKQKFGRGYSVEVAVREPSQDAIDDLCNRIQRILGTEPAVSKDSIPKISSALGIVDRGEMVLTGEGDGWVLSSYLESNGSIPLDVFCSWWLSQDRSEVLQEFFSTKLAGSQLVEHQGDHFRFQVPKDTLRPHVIFGLLEENKTQLHVNEYGVSETSLEHIFNNMAAQQDEERLVANGVYNDASKQ